MLHSFKAILEKGDEKTDNAFVRIPFDVVKIYGTRGQVKVKATFDDHPYRGVMANMGKGGHMIGVLKAIRKAIGKNVGDSLRVTIEKDMDERMVVIPPELETVFARNPKAKSRFEILSFTNRKEYALWISSAKKPETKERRLKDIVGKLMSGKKNPSEK